jgi:hypothetical protein
MTDDFSTLRRGNTAMVRLAILDQDGKHLMPQDVTTAGELLTIVEQARSVMQDCERLARQMVAKSGTTQQHQIPYMS